MYMSPDCRQEITEPSEGLRLVSYRDCVGVWTIGYGHTSRAGSPVVTPGMAITKPEADTILARDIQLFERGVTEALGSTPTLQREFDAMVDLAFNIGLGAFRGSSLLRAFKAGQHVEAARKFMDWNKAGGKVISGLTVRRRREQAWFIDGRLGARTTTIFDANEVLDIAHEVDHADGWFARLKGWWRS